MTFLLCPLCGKMTSLNNFNPSNFDLDIYEQDVVGLGRGKGFQVTAKYSILHSDATVLIKERLLDLLRLLHKNGLLSRLEVERRLGLTNNEETKAIAALIEEKNASINELNEEVGALRASQEELLDGIREIIQLVEDRLGSEFEADDPDDPLNSLRDLLERLTDDYEALKADMEEIHDE